ncbi:MAG: hypothetical protein F9K25_11710 [Candidatus Contendobacter sp.]|nr:MAG: hypothetical protein F9K25_11710 [Candidatus Contendobacter sp.]
MPLAVAATEAVQTAGEPLHVTVTGLVGFKAALEPEAGAVKVTCAPVTGSAWADGAALLTVTIRGLAKAVLIGVLWLSPPLLLRVSPCHS